MLIKDYTLNVLHQWKELFRYIHYKLFIEKVIVKLNKRIRFLEKKNKDLIKKYKNEMSIRKTYIGKFKCEKEPEKSLKLYLEHKTVKQKFFDRIRNFLHHKLKLNFLGYGGYIFYLDKGNNFHIYKIKDLKFLWRKKSQELYNIDEKVGHYKGKPVFLIKYPYAITLNFNEDNDGKDLYYDTESYYNLVDMAIKGRLTQLPKDSFDLITFIKNNLILLIILGIVAFVLFTDEGKQMLKDTIK